MGDTLIMKTLKELTVRKRYFMRQMEKSAKRSLQKKIEEKTAVVGIVGLGYVGLPTAFHKAADGYKVIGFDVTKDKVEKVNKGQNYINDINDQAFTSLVLEEKKLSATTDFAKMEEVDVALICVPTPINEYKQPDLSFVESAAKALAPYAHKGMLVILESTTYPGTTNELLVPIFEEKGFTIGKDFFLAYSPERIDPGNKQFNLKNTAKIVGGVTKNCTALAAKFIGETAYKVSSPEVAEMSKVYENTFRWINIGFANETAKLCDKMGIDIWEVINASKTKPYGFMAFYPGPGVGGHCIPVDPYYLTYKAKEIKESTKMIELAGEVNDSMADEVINRAMRILNKDRKAINGSKITILGVTYKKDIDDLRESPVLPILEKLSDAGANLSIVDPNVSKVKVNGKETIVQKYSDTLMANSDLVILTTEHTNFDYQAIATHAPVIFDTKNAFNNIKNMTASLYKL